MRHVRSARSRLNAAALALCADTPTWYVYLNCPSGAYPGDKLGVTRRIWYTWTDEHVYKTAGQRTYRHSAIRPGGVS